MKANKTTIFLILFFVSCLSSCNYPYSNRKQLQETALSNAITQVSYEYSIKATIYAYITQTAMALKPSQTIEPTGQDIVVYNQIIPTLSTAIISIPINGSDKGEFISETIPDGSDIVVGQGFTKSWIIQNQGSSNWTTDYSIVFVDGSKMNAPDKIKLPVSVQPEKIIEIKVPFIAPSTPGKYKSVWMLENNTGKRFGLGKDGRSFWVEIDAVNSGQITPTMPLTPSPPPLIGQTPLPTLPLLATLPPWPTMPPWPTLPPIPTNPPYPTNEPTATNVPQMRAYVVKEGETCVSIANDFNIPVQLLIEANNFPPECVPLYAGQYILVYQWIN